MIEQIVEEIEALPDAKAATRFSKNFADSQSELVAFALGALEESSSETQELAYFCALVTWRFYSKANNLRTVTEAAIEKAFEATNAEMAAIEAGDATALSKIIFEERLKSDEVFRFVVEEIFSAREEDTITEDDAGNLIVVLKVVIDCLASVADHGADGQKVDLLALT